jgi:hypothetical protein
MGLIVSYDDKFATPYSEIELANGDHVLLTLDRDGLTVKALARPGNAERLLFRGNPDIVAKICTGLLDEDDDAKIPPLRVLVSVTSQLPSAAAVADAFKAAAG